MSSWCVFFMNPLYTLYMFQESKSHSSLFWFHPRLYARLMHRSTLKWISILLPFAAGCINNFPHHFCQLNNTGFQVDWKNNRKGGVTKRSGSVSVCKLKRKITVWALPSALGGRSPQQQDSLCCSVTQEGSRAALPPSQEWTNVLNTNAVSSPKNENALAQP